MVSLLEGDKRRLSVFIHRKGRQAQISGISLESAFSPCVYSKHKYNINFQIQCINCKIWQKCISIQLTFHTELHSIKKEEKELHWNRVTMLLGLIPWKYHNQVTGIPLTLHLLLKLGQEQPQKQHWGRQKVKNHTDACIQHPLRKEHLQVKSVFVFISNLEFLMLSFK